jgi:transcriptional regulator with XRE-family HTH domain
MAHDPHLAPATGGTRRRGRPGARDVDLEVARRVHRRRLELGLTLQDVAERLGVTSRQVHKYETGASRVSAGRLHQIAEVLGVEIVHLFAGVDPAGLPGGAEPDEAGRGQRRRLLELVRHVAAIRDRGHREAVCALARALATLGGEAGASRRPKRGHVGRAAETRPRLPPSFDHRRLEAYPDLDPWAGEG